MFADFAHLGFHTSCVPFEIRNQIVKDLVSFRYKTKPNPQQSSINYRLQRIGSTLSLEERRLHPWGQSAFARFKA